MFDLKHSLLNKLLILILTCSLFNSFFIFGKAAAYPDESVPVSANSNEQLVMSDFPYVMPESFGAKGDGIVDDTEAIQKALDSMQPVLLLPKTYRTTSTIQISGPTSITDTGSTIMYEGEEAAIRFTAVSNRCNVFFGRIYAESGTGIEFYCDSNNNACQYVNLHFNVIRAKNYGIFFNRNGQGSTSENGWLNEIRIYDGRLSSGKYGIYADAHGINCINNIKCINVAFEGVDVGAYIANGCRGWSFVNTRIAEMSGIGKTSFITVGQMVGLNIILNDAFKTWNSKFSPETQGAVIAPIYTRNLSYENILVGNIGEIINGKLYTYNQLMMSLRNFEELPEFTDLNTVLEPGNYSCLYRENAISFFNSPAVEPFTMLVSYRDSESKYISQEIHLTYTFDIYRRTYIVDEHRFTDWQKNVSVDDLFEIKEEVNELRAIVEEILAKPK